MKKLLSALLCAAILLSLCACSQNDVPQQDPVIEPEQADTAADESTLMVADRDKYTLAWPEMQNADFWIGLEEDPQAVRMTAGEIEAYNAAMYSQPAAKVENLDAWAESLTAGELEYLPWGARLMTLECGMRFLGDYLNGDVYFSTSREGQNLDRARTQLKLVADMESKLDLMRKITARYSK